MITREDVRALFKYSKVTGVMSYRQTRGRCKKDDQVGTLLTNGYLRTIVKGKSYYVHRLAFLFVTGRLPHEIDHENGVKTDNRFANLRECRRYGNEGNKTLRSDNKSGFKGIWKHGDKWTARIASRYLGTFDTREDAARAYDVAARQHYGKFALTNKRMGLFK